jgi:hypothetical protein
MKMIGNSAYSANDSALMQSHIAALGPGILQAPMESWPKQMDG